MVGSGLVGIRCTFNDKSGNDYSFDEIAKASFAEDRNFDRFSTRWFQRLGHSVRGVCNESDEFENPLM